MPSRTKQLQTFMIDDDEYVFSFNLKEKYKGACFLDNNLWDKIPKFVDSIDECQSKYCYIWNKDIFHNLPTFVRKNGKIEGPISGIVIQFIRSTMDEQGNLLSGRIAVGYDTAEKEFEKFVKDTWKILKKVGQVGVYHVPLFGSVDKSKVIKEYVVGNAVKDAIASQRINLLRHTSTQVYFTPID